MSYTQTQRTEKGLFYAILLIAIVLVAASCQSKTRDARFRMHGLWKSYVDHSYHSYVNKEVIEVDSAFRVGDTITVPYRGVYVIEERVK